MNISKREKIMVIAAGGVLVIALVYQFVIYPGTQKKSKPARKPTPQKQATPSASTRAAKGAATTARPANKPANADIKNFDSWGRDPFSAKAAPSQTTSTTPATRRTPTTGG